VSAPGGISVSARELTRRFGDFVAVSRVSFEVRKGEVFGFLGPNGAGKSTTLRMLCGLLAPTEGEATVAGCDVRTQAESVKEHIGYMSQRFSLYEDLTVEENIDFFGGIYRIPQGRKRERKEWAIRMAGLSDHRRARAGHLSGGWKQRLALGCAILHEPPILFLDEPTSGTDPISRRSFWDLIYALSGSGTTVFVTTHHMDEAEYCDRLGLVYRGELVAMGSPGELKAGVTREEILDVRCDRPQEAIGLLERMPGVSGAALFGGGIHAAVVRGSTTPAGIVEALRAAGIPVERAEPIPPSLEDAFVSLVEERDRMAGPLAEVRR
jgi:ABC-2 type transport system ATP-binding protein